jgi:transcriptional regulator with XRE-family HTH domain
MANFNTRLKELKEKNNISNQELADAIGISVRGLQFYLSGTKEPTLNKLILLAKFFNISLDYITGISDDPKSLN